MKGAGHTIRYVQRLFIVFSSIIIDFVHFVQFFGDLLEYLDYNVNKKEVKVDVYSNVI